MFPRTLKLSTKKRKTLIEYRDHDPRPDIRERCAAILKIADGQSPHAVARHGLLRVRDPDTVYNWLNRYEKQGMEGLLSGRQGGPGHRGPFRGARDSVGAASARPGGGRSPRGHPDGRWSVAELVDVANHPGHVSTDQ